MTSDGTRTLEWDARNQLVAVNVGTHRSEFTYDGLQRRSRRVRTVDDTIITYERSISCAMRVCAVREAGAQDRFLLFAGEATQARRSYYVHDHVDRPQASTDVSGLVTSPSIRTSKRTISARHWRTVPE